MSSNVLYIKQYCSDLYRAKRSTRKLPSFLQLQLFNKNDVPVQPIFNNEPHSVDIGENEVHRD